jgi:murein DD-endopeptidase MepM/ murein hydrolase activator NlpD
MRRMRGLLKKLIVKLQKFSLFFLLIILGGCDDSPLAMPQMAPYVIKKVKAAPIQLPIMIVHSEYGTKEVHPSVWNAKTLKFSEGIPQKIVVKKGESLFTLSKKYAVPLPLIIEKNHLKPPFFIYPGQTLVLVGPKVHIVQKEDLYEIAALHNVSLSALTQQNNLPPGKPLQTGQKLILPAQQATVTSSTLTTSPKSYKSPIQAAPRAARPLSSSSSLMGMSLPKRTGNKFNWPVKGQVISGFGPKGHGLYNDGINISAPRGAKVQAAENGIVVYYGNDIKSYGNLVLVKHSDGWMTAYAHLDKIIVQKGQEIKRNDVLGHVGMSGFVQHPQLHFELRKNGRPQNPVSHLHKRTI